MSWRARRLNFRALRMALIACPFGLTLRIQADSAGVCKRSARISRLIFKRDTLCRALWRGVLAYARRRMQPEELESDTKPQVKAQNVGFLVAWF